MQLIFVLLALFDFYIDIQFNFYMRYARASRDDPYFIWLRVFILNRCLRMSLIIQQFTRIRKLLNVIYFNKMAILRILGLFITVLSCYSQINVVHFLEKLIQDQYQMINQIIIIFFLVYLLHQNIVQFQMHNRKWMEIYFCRLVEFYERKLKIMDFSIYILLQLNIYWSQSIDEFNCL